MQHISRWTAVLAALCLTAACSDSASTTAPAFPSSVWAEVTASSCQAELETLRAAIDGATFTGKNASTNRANLRLKADEAQAKLADGKAADAIQKLENIRTTVVALSTPDVNGKTKLDPEDAAAIIEAVNAAEACINVPASPVA